ncbi:hypothetical protein [Lentzea waywayandensis]|uniref:hypothetical protein n=1 Tax=Lentzea waywayandensis TaxID=84724 RepID=UPI000B8807B4|nr:hypothetical protein [Lentzea waywayandensis]
MDCNVAADVPCSPVRFGAFVDAGGTFTDEFGVLVDDELFGADVFVWFVPVLLPVSPGVLLEEPDVLVEPLEPLSLPTPVPVPVPVPVSVSTPLLPLPSRLMGGGPPCTDDPSGGAPFCPVLVPKFDPALVPELEPEFDPAFVPEFGPEFVPLPDPEFDPEFDCDPDPEWVEGEPSAPRFGIPLPGSYPATSISPGLFSASCLNFF